MARSNKRKNVAPASSETSRPTKRQRKATRPFEQGVNPPAPPTPPSTVRRPQHSQNPSQLRDRNTPSPLFEPETIATASQVASIPAEDEDDEEEFANGAADDDDEPVQNVLDSVRAVEEPAAARTVGSPGVAAAATVAQSTQQQRPESRVEEINAEPHLHFRYRAWWGAIEKNGIASASDARRNKALYTVNEDKVWRWADGVIESQKPRVANIKSLTATLYYTSGNRQARADRCTIALQRSRSVAGEGLIIGNWFDFEDEVTEMDKESGQVLSCDFDLVLKEELLAQQPALQSASQPSRGAIRARPGIVTAIQEDGLASIVTNERCASGSAISIRDYWRCHEERCHNRPLTCWVRRPHGQETDRFENHYPVSGNIIASWASAIARGECTIEEPSDDIRLALMMARDQKENNQRRRRRKVSPTSSNSSIESLTKAILVGHLAQMRAPQQHCHQQCRQQSPGQDYHQKKWRDFICSRRELEQHTHNFFRYWEVSMSWQADEIKRIKKLVFTQHQYDINMLMDNQDGLSLDAWIKHFKQAPSMLSHLRRKAHDWRRDYAGLSESNHALAQACENDPELDDSPPPERSSQPEQEQRVPLGEVSRN